MTRVLLVYHDANVADLEGDDLRRAGYEVDRCAGPVGGGLCPVLQGRPCWQVEKADVLIYDTWDAEFGHAVLVEDLLELHPDKPLVLTSNVDDPGVRDHQAAARWPLVAPSRTDLVPTIELALQLGKADDGHPSASHRVAPHYTGPRW